MQHKPETVSRCLKSGVPSCTPASFHEGFTTKTACRKCFCACLFPLRKWTLDFQYKRVRFFTLHYQRGLILRPSDSSSDCFYVYYLNESRFFLYVYASYRTGTWCVCLHCRAVCFRAAECSRCRTPGCQRWMQWLWLA